MDTTIETGVQPFPSVENGSSVPKEEHIETSDLKSEAKSISSRNASSTNTNAKVTQTNTKPTQSNGSNSSIGAGRRRSNSQSQVIALPNTKPGASTSSSTSSLTRQRGIETPRKRAQIQYYVTLVPLNDTFIKKHLPVATFPDTTKLGRPTGTKHKPDVTNGYFDSRVLSRNHAQIYIDPKNGKLMLQDLGSSNGTYLNDVRLTNEAVEMKVGDVVCLGFNVQAESTHKQISLKIDNINVIGTGSGNSAAKSAHKQSELLPKGQTVDSMEFKHLSFIEDIYKQVVSMEKDKTTKNDQQNKSNDFKEIRKSLQTSAHSKDNLSFDNALFGDINPLLEDSLLGLYSQVNSGIYNNSQLTNTGSLESTINLLIMNLSKAKQQSQSLRTLENFFGNYQRRLKEINTDFLDGEFKRTLGEIQADLKKQRLSNQKLKERHKASEESSLAEIEKLNSKLKMAEIEKEKLNDVVIQLVENEAKRKEEETKEMERRSVEWKKLEDERESYKLALSHSQKENQKNGEKEEKHGDDRSNRDIILLQGLASKLTISDGKENGRDKNDPSVDSDTKKSMTTTQDTVVDVHGLFSELNNSAVQNKYPFGADLLKDSSNQSVKSVSSSVSPPPDTNSKHLITSVTELTPPASDEETPANEQNDNTEREPVRKPSQYPSELESVESSLSVSNELNGAQSIVIAIMVVTLGYLIKRLT